MIERLRGSSRDFEYGLSSVELISLCSYPHADNLHQGIRSHRTIRSIELGITRDTLRSMIGDPDCWGGPDAKSLDTADIWKYGDIEFYLDKANGTRELTCKPMSWHANCIVLRQCSMEHRNRVHTHRPCVQCGDDCTFAD